MSDHHHYKQRDFQFAQRLMALRKKAGLTQEEIALKVGVASKSIRNWEGGCHYPTGPNLQKLIELCLDRNVFEPGHERAEALVLWEQLQKSTYRATGIFDEQRFAALLQQSQARRSSAEASVEKLQPGMQSSPSDQQRGEPLPALQAADSNMEAVLSTSSLHQEDWGEAPDTSSFAGREQELAMLSRRVLSEHCRLVALLGMGGIGKTALATTFARQAASQFEVVIWRSLHNAPSLDEILSDYLQAFANQSASRLSHSIDQRLALLIACLREHRCLLVFDNVETIFQGGEQAGSYRQGYEDYSTLFLRVGASVHQSCLLLTSREAPTELALLEGMKGPVVSTLKMAGLAWEESRALLEDTVLFGEPQTWHELSERYAGNPLALKIVAGEIHELFGGDIAAFLREGHLTFHGIRALLSQQMERLSPLEQEVLYWLAIERDWTSLEGLRATMVQVAPPGELLEALSSLRRRSLIERGEREAVFTLQPVVLEYLTDCLTKQVCHEILILRPELLLRYALVRAQAKDYIRNSQGQLILQVVLDSLLVHMWSIHRVEEQLDQLIQLLRTLPVAEQGYGGGNVINLLVRLNGHVRGKDCSHLRVWQADLREAEAQNANFAGADLRGSVFLETINGIVSVALSANGQYVAGGANTGEIHVWSLRDGQPLMVLMGHVRHVWSLVFHPESTLLVSGGYDGLVKVWDIGSRQCLSILHGHTRWVRSMAFHPTGRLLATSSNDGSIRLWDVTAGRCIKVWYEQTTEIWAVAFSPDGQLLASGDAVGIVKIWDLSSEQCLRTITTYSGAGASVLYGALSLAFSPDGALLVSGGMDTRIRVWETSSGKLLSTLTGHTDIVYSVAFHPEGLLASGSLDCTVRLWQVGEGGAGARCLGTLQEHTAWLWAVAFGPAGLLASGGQDGIVKLWQINKESGSGKCVRTLRGYARMIETVALSPDGKMLASGENNGTVRLWETTHGQCLRILPRQVGYAIAQAFSPDGRLLAKRGGPNNAIQIWEIDSGRCLRMLKGHQGEVWTVAFSPDERFLLSGSRDTTIKLWEVSTGECLTTFRGHSSWVWSLACSPDGRLFASGGFEGVVKIWERSSGRCLHTLHGSSRAIMALAFTPESQELLSSNEQDLVTIWDVQRGACLKTIPGMGETYWPGSVAFSAGGSLLAVVSSDQTVKVWKVNNGALLRTFPSSAGRPWSVTWSADQRLLACGTDEGAVLLWEMQTGQYLMTLRGDRPYECMNITGVTGITQAQKVTLKVLGAFEEEDGTKYR